MPEGRSTSVTPMEESMRRAMAAIASLPEHAKRVDDALLRLERSLRDTLMHRAPMATGSPQFDPNARIAQLMADIATLRRNRQLSQ